MKKINSFIEKNIEKIIIFFLFLQPILDATTAIFFNSFNIDLSISSIVRLIFLIFCIYYLIRLDKTKNKKNNIKYLIILLIYFLLYISVVLIHKDKSVLFYEIRNMLNTFYLPVMLIALIDIFKQYKIKFKLTNIISIYMVYVLLVVFPNLTNLGFQSYSHSKLGSVGWFISANAIGDILSILLPFVFLYLIESKSNKWLKIFIVCSILYLFLTLGTKVPVLSLIICLIFNLIYFLIKWYKDKKYKNILISIISIFVVGTAMIFVVPKTSFYKNIEIHKKFLKIDNYMEVFTDYKLLDHFIFSERLTFLNNTNKNYQKASLEEKMLGIGYIENYATYKVSTKTIEIDYFEIFYRHGIVGFLIYFYIVLASISGCIKKLNKNSLINMEYKNSIFLIIVLAFFSGHVLVTPAVSIYVSLIFAVIMNGMNIKNKNL